MSLEIGKIARLKTPVIQGEIVDTQYNRDSRSLEHKIQWTDVAGENQERWFGEAELEVVNDE